MKTANGGQSRFRASVHGEGRASSPCKRGCCWTPGFGHSTVRDVYPPSDPRACHCHDDERGGDAA
jgi:hypothetical protein